MNEWQENTGVAPDLPEGVLVDVRFVGEDDFNSCTAKSWFWGLDGGITHWRISDYKVHDAPVEDILEVWVNGKPARNKYMREIKPGVWVDVYDVIRAFAVTDGALQHLLKKALAVGQRGHKDAGEDYKDILDSAQRAYDIYKEWNHE